MHVIHFVASASFVFIQFVIASVLVIHAPADNRNPLSHSKHYPAVASIQSKQLVLLQETLQKGAEERAFLFPQDTVIFVEYKHYVA